MRSGPCACLSSMYVQNLPTAHAFAVVSLHSLSSVFDYFLVPLSFMAYLLRGWALLDGGLCLFSAHPFSYYHFLPYHSIIPAAKLFASILLDLFGPAVAHSHFSTTYTAHGLLFLSFRAPLSPFTPSRSICLSHGPVIYYLCRLDLMSFLFIYQLFSVRVVGFLLSLGLPKWPSTTISPKLIFSKCLVNLL